VNAAELADDAISILAPHLPALKDQAVRAQGGAGLRQLYEMIQQRFSIDGALPAFAAFVADPANDSLARHLLSTAITADPEFGGRLETAVAREESAARSSTSTTQHVSRSKVGTMAGRDVNTNRNSQVNTGGLFVTIVVVAIVALVAYLGVKAAAKAASPGITADSTCAQFLDADPDTEQRAIVKIAMAEDVTGAGSPLALPAIRYNCSAEPDAKLGDVIAKYRGKF
jgi:hypothetical protein